ncbi:hypothetical protein KCTC52924_01533 [Arenibacter antarcticus]
MDRTLVFDPFFFENFLLDFRARVGLLFFTPKKTGKRKILLLAVA